MSFIETFVIELVKSPWAAMASVVSGVALFLVGQVVQRFVFDPAIELRKTVAEIGFLLVFHADVIQNPDPANTSGAYMRRVRKAHLECRRLAGALPFSPRPPGWSPRPPRRAPPGQAPSLVSGPTDGATSEW